MKLELKALDVHTRMSEETWNYSASLYLDGKHVADVGNHGTGGPDNFYPKPGQPRDLLDRINAHLAATNPPAFEIEGKPYPVDLEIWCGERINERVALLDMRRNLRRAILFVRPGKGLMESRYKGVRTITAVHLAEWRKSHPGIVPLNDMPEADALKVYREQAA